jgi:hypothetical protein
MKIHEALAKVMTEVGAVGKNDRNGQQGWSFRGVDAVVNAVAPAMKKHGVIVLPRVTNHDVSLISVSGGKQMRSVVVTVRYTFIGPSGDQLEAVSVGEAFDSGDKATAKAMSVALRTCLLQALLLPTDEPDPDHDIYEVSPATPPVNETFNPGDAATWPQTLTAAQAKKVVLTAANNDRAKAAGLWEDTLAKWGSYPAIDVEQWLTEQ